jgi:hypothetical protein
MTFQKQSSGNMNFTDPHLTKTENVFALARQRFFRALSAKNLLTFDEYKVGKASIRAASNADYNNRASVSLSNAVAEKIVANKQAKKLPGQTQGDLFEELVSGFLSETFPALGHLADLARFCSENRELASALGNDYAISPDVVVFRMPETDAKINQKGDFLGNDLAQRSPLRKAVSSHPILHACISCKFTFRSDRAQNARSEALNLIRNRKGRTPHLVIVTAECLPSRLASVALGTGDIDCLYHIALPELIESTDKDEFPDAYEMLQTMVAGRRIRDLTDLPLDLAV